MAIAITALTVGILAVVGVRLAILYRRTGRPLHGGLFAAIALLAQAQLSMYLAPAWHVSWWEYHGLMLSAFAVAIGGIIVEFVHGSGLNGLIEGLLLQEAVEQVQRGYTEIVGALVEAKDPYTRGHTQRVSELAVLVGEEMGLPADQIQTLYRASMLHDIGKIGIPDSILNKPGRLSPQEFEIVKQHPARGHLIGDEIPLIARIIAVADVYDALTSARPYRGASAMQETLDIIDWEAGTKLDAACVAALHRACNRLAVQHPEPIQILSRVA